MKVGVSQMNQNMMVVFLAGFVLGGFVSVFAMIEYPTFWDRANVLVCEDFNAGRWNSDEARCVSSDCYYNKSCGTVAWIGERCERLKAGDPIARAYFHLGNPVRTEGPELMWQWHEATEAGPVAEVEADRLTSIRCDRPDGLKEPVEEGFKLPFSDKRGNIMD